MSKYQIKITAVLTLEDSKAHFSPRVFTNMERVLSKAIHKGLAVNEADAGYIKHGLFQPKEVNMGRVQYEIERANPQVRDFKAEIGILPEALPSVPASESERVAAHPEPINGEKDK